MDGLIESGPLDMLMATSEFAVGKWALLRLSASRPAGVVDRLRFCTPMIVYSILVSPLCDVYYDPFLGIRTHALAYLPH